MIEITVRIIFVFPFSTMFISERKFTPLKTHKVTAQIHVGEDCSVTFIFTSSCYCVNKYTIYTDENLI